MRHYDQEEREANGAVHWKSMGPAFQREGGHTSSDSDWLQHIYKRKHQDQVPILQKLSRRPIVCSRYSRTHWWERDCA